MAVAAGVLVLTSWGPLASTAVAQDEVYATQSQIRELSQRLDRIERMLDSSAMQELLRGAESMNREIRELRGEAETLRHEVERLGARQRDQFRNLDERVAAFETGEALPADTAAPTEEVIEFDLPEADEQAAYQEAFDQLMAGDYSAAMSSLEHRPRAGSGIRLARLCTARHRRHGLLQGTDAEHRARTGYRDRGRGLHRRAGTGRRGRLHPRGLPACGCLWPVAHGAGASGLGRWRPDRDPPAEKIEIGTDGTISVRPQGVGPEALAAIERIRLVNPDVNELERGDDGLFRMADGGEAPVDAEVRVVSGMLEGSNVNTVEALTRMIELSRHFEMQVKMMDSANTLEQSSNRLLGLG